MTTLGGCTSKISNSSSSSSVAMSLEEFLSMYGGSSSASEEEKQEKVTATFKNYDDEILYTTEVIKGDTVEYKGETPIRPSDERVRHYTFIGWDKPLNDLMVDTEFIAQYLEDLNTFRVDFMNYDGTLLFTDTVAYGENAEYEGEIPTRPSNERVKTYTFSGWNVDLNNVTTNLVAYPEFDEELNTFTIEFRNYDDTLLYTDVVEYGGNAEYKGATPTKPGDERVKTYTFIGWDNEEELKDVTSNRKVTAQYSEELNTFRVEFRNYDNTLLYTDIVEYGGTATYKGELPTRPSDDRVENYTFSGWDNENQLSNVTSNLVLKAQYSEELNVFSVEFRNYDDSLLYTDVVKYGGTAEYKGKTPFRPSDERVKTYTFIGWENENELKNVTSNRKVTAQYSEKLNTFTVEFKNYDDSLLYTDTVEYGGTAEYKGKTPTRPRDERVKTYTFCGWDKEDQLSNVTSNLVLKAQYSEELNTFNVEFRNYDNTLLYTDVVEYGGTAEYEGDTPTRPGDERVKTYTFSGWDKEDQLNNVTSNLVVKAQYSEELNTFKVEFKNYDDTLLFTDIVEYGGTAKYEGETPTRLGDEQENYVFIGWDIEDQLTNVTSNLVAKAMYGPYIDLETLNITYTLDKKNHTYTVTGVKDEQVKNIDLPRQLTIDNVIYELESIGYHAFSDCSSLTSITIPDSVTSIEYSAFNNCTQLQSVTFEPNSKLKSIGDSAFKNCSSITSIVIPSSVISIEKWAFDGCRSLTSITISNSVTSIGYGAFYGCGYLEQVNYGGTISEWASIDFGNEWANPLSKYRAKLYISDELQENIVLEGIEKIGSYAFYNCDFIKTISILDSVTSIGEYAFKDCSFLTSITIPSNVTSIGYHAFYDCDSLTIYCEASSKPSGWDSDWNYSNRPVYWGINEINFIEKDGIQYVIINEEAVITRYVGTSTNVVIPTTIEFNGKTYDVTSIGRYAFSNCSELQNVTFEPNSKLKSIGDYAFCDCDSIERVNFKGTISQWASIDFGNKDANPLSNNNAKLYINDKLQENIVLEGIEKIGNYVFYNCGFIKTITIKDDVTSIGEDAFRGCSSLTSITIPNSVTSIGKAAFSDCNSLIIYCEVSEKPSGWDDYWNYDNWNSRYIPVYWGINENNFTEKDGIKYVIVDEEAVITRYVGTSTNVVIPTTIEFNGKTYDVTSIGGSAFYKCTQLQSITFEPNSKLESIGDYAFSGCSSLTNITIPNSVTSIEKEAFSRCTGLQTVTFEPNSKLESIGEDAFFYCSSLKTITVPSSVTNIREGAFSNCIRLKSIDFEPNSKLKNIDAAAFYQCYSLTSITIPSSVTSIGKAAFSDCNSLTNIIIPSGVASIENQTFSGCSSLINITLPSSVTNIGESAFHNCTKLQNVTFESNSNLKSIGLEAFRNCNSLKSITIPSSVTSIGICAFTDCSSLTIYCEASSRPSGWNNDWNNYGGTVYWGNQWHYENGVPTLN